MHPVDPNPSAEVSRHIPALDGIRALAILLVMPHNIDLLTPPVPLFAYPAIMLTHAGWIGVQLFFVLSGFLISGNLLDTRGAGNYFSAFFGRRALRILPLYFAVLCLAFVIAPLLVALPPELRATQSHQVWLWTFLTNWTQPYDDGVYGFTHFWSLAVEEQFYLLWPFVVLFCRPAALLWASLVTAVIALAVRVLLAVEHFPHDTLYMFTVCRMDALAFGAAAAALVRIPATLERLRRAVPAVAVAAAIALLAAAAITRGFALYDVSTQTVGYTILSVAFALVILLAALPTTGALQTLMRVLACTPLRFIGRYSYGMYVFHLPLHVFFGAELMHRIAPHPTATQALAYTTVMMVITFVLAALSYELFERQFLKLKRKMMPTPGRDAPAPVAAD
jgi:peptidoglycan/LPS O-acetylase OafA/YrhL